MERNKSSWIMPLVRIMWLDLSQEEREEVTMTIQKCLDDSLDEMIEAKQTSTTTRDIGLTKYGRTAAEQRENSANVNLH